MIAGASLVLLIAIIAASAMYGGKPDMVPLFSNMETKDAGEVAAKYIFETVSEKIKKRSVK